MSKFEKFPKTDDVIDRTTSEPSEREHALVVAEDLGRALGRNLVANHGQDLRRIFKINHEN